MADRAYNYFLMRRKRRAALDASTTPAISGTPSVGQTLTFNSTSYTAHRWLNNGAEISGAVSSSYVVQAGDSGDSISVRARHIPSGLTVTSAAVTVS